MQKKTISISVAETNRQVKIKAPVKDSLHGSMLSDRLDKLPYLKVIERKYVEPTAFIKAHTIVKEFTLEKLYDDLDQMSDLINIDNESL